MNKGEIIQENNELKAQIKLYKVKLTRALYTIDELEKENAELKDWKSKWEDRYNAGI